MSVNKYLPHVYVLPEDDANRQLANGFFLDPALAVRNIYVLEEVGGWNEVLSRFQKDHIADMDRHQLRFMILLMDFDGQRERLALAKKVIPAHLESRVFVLGALTEPEALKRAGLGSYETIGVAMAKDCRENTAYAIWNHELLCNNASELARLRESVRPILFK